MAAAAGALVFLQCSSLPVISKRSINSSYRNKSPFSHRIFCSMNSDALGQHFSLTKTEKLRFNEYMTSKIKQVNEALDQTVSSEHPTEIQEAMRYSLLSPGKRIRSVLCLSSCELVGGDDSLVMPVACAIEMMQAMSLMLDDLPCIDDDDLRRGNPASHKVFGEEGAILAGGSLSILAFQHIVENTKNVSAERVLRAISELASATGFDGVLGGQLLDVRCEGKEVSVSELEYISLLKTAKFFEASAVCGAIIGGGSETDVERLRKYARYVGLMAQVVNDIMDLTKSSEELGKISSRRDLERDKATYPKLMGIEGAKKFALELMLQAMEHLSYFDATKAFPLRCLANHLFHFM